MCKAKCVILEPLAEPNGIEQTGFINAARLPLFGQTDCPHTIGSANAIVSNKKVG